MSKPPPGKSVPLPPGAFSTPFFSYSNFRQFEPHGPFLIFRADRRNLWERDAAPLQVLVKRAQDTQDEEGRQRLLVEASLLLLMDHPNIPQVIELANYESGPHVVVQYVEGLTLERVLNKAAKRVKPLSEPFTVYVASQVAAALHHIHTRTDDAGHSLQLIHRSVSPRNILVTDSGAVRLSDFSAVRAPLPWQTGTASTVLQGEVDYAAPEVLRMKAQDPRADLFSLGLVMVELLSLQHLYDSPHQARPPRLKRLLSRLLSRVRAQNPSWADPVELAARASQLQPVEVERALAHVSEPLRRIVLRTLRINPGERHPTAAALKEELQALHSGQSPHEVVREVREAVTMAASAHGVVDTSGESIPSAFTHPAMPRH